MISIWFFSDNLVLSCLIYEREKCFKIDGLFSPLQSDREVSSGLMGIHKSCNSIVDDDSGVKLSGRSSPSTSSDYNDAYESDLSSIGTSQISSLPNIPESQFNASTVPSASKVCMYQFATYWSVNSFRLYLLFCFSKIFCLLWRLLLDARFVFFHFEWKNFFGWPFRHAYANAEAKRADHPVSS